MKKFLKIELMGRVQGVGYRFASQDKARKLGVVGFIKNQDDGSVTAEIGGSEEDVNVFLNWLKSGYKWADVYDFNVEEITEKKDYKDFIIKY